MRVAATAPIGPLASAGEERQNLEMDLADEEREESIAEGIMGHKRLLSLQQGVRTLQKTSRTHHEIVMRLEKAMSDTISETDLRRAIGLALEEFDTQLVEAFRDSNRKCMSMFAKAEDVSEIQGKIDKKVNIADYNSVLQKIIDIRRYVDTMAESVFIGHQESKEEFAKEVNVEKALQLKADVVELTEVRATLERLEAVIAARDLKHEADLETLRELVTQSNSKNIETNRSMIAANRAMIEDLAAKESALDDRMTTVEKHMDQKGDERLKLEEKVHKIEERQEGVIWITCQSLQTQFQGMVSKVSDLGAEEKLMHSRVEQLEGFVSQKFQQVFDSEEQVMDQIKFLMEASEMLKRRSREFNKSCSAQLKDLASSESKLTEQMSTLERLLKVQERELRALEKRSPNAIGNPAPPLDPVPLDPNQHLKGVLAQLERIAGGIGEKLPPPSDLKATADSDLGLISALAGLTSQSPQTSARAQGAYGLSPRLPLPRPAPPTAQAIAAIPSPGTARSHVPRRLAH